MTEQNYQSQDMQRHYGSRAAEQRAHLSPDFVTWHKGEIPTRQYQGHSRDNLYETWD